MKTKCLIYCRVSSQRQVIEGHGLDSQQQRCEAYAKNKNYDIVGVFPDEGVSGGLFERPAMQKLINFLDTHPTEQFIIIFDDLARFARDLKVHLQLKSELVSRGAQLESPNFIFENSPEGELIENVVQSQNQYQRQTNRRQVIQKQKARLERGYWAFCVPKGLINQKNPIHGKILVRREPYATIYKEGIEKYRDGVLPSILDFQAFCNEKYKEHGVNHVMSHSSATNTLKDVLYAGYVEYPKWGVARRKGQHEGFISIETYEAVQERLLGRSKPWRRKDYNLDFPLRPHVLCDNCGVPMSGAFNTGRKGQRYPHYYCRGEGCKYLWKSIGKDKFENQFEMLLLGVKPADELIDLTKDVLLAEWNNRLEDYVLIKSNIKSEFTKVQEEIEDFVERAGKAKDQTLIDIYEGKIKDLADKKKELEQKLRQNNYSDKDFGTAVDKVFNTLKKPLDMWQSDEYNDKRTILFMYFEDKLRYDYFSGFGTTTLAYPLELITKNRPLRSGSVEMSESDPESKNLH
ncbi:MAG: recombinase family protein [bacterium]|nr:recombinase family protein [bacterium]